MGLKNSDNQKITIIKTINMKVNLTNYGDNHLELNATQLEATIISKEDASELLGKDASNKVCVFESPTGRGKTVMVAKFIEEIITELPEKDLCFFHN